MKSCEQLARDILDRMGIPSAQEFPASQVIEVANLIAEVKELRKTRATTCVDCGGTIHTTVDKCSSCFYFPEDKT